MRNIRHVTLLRLQVLASPRSALYLPHKRVHRHEAHRKPLARRLFMPHACACHVAPAWLSIYYYTCSFIPIPHSMCGGSQPRFLRTADFGCSRKARLEAPGSCRDACLSCMHHFSCHARCACSMACRAHAYRARARPRSALSPAWQKPARRHRCRTGTPLRMQPMLHAIGSHAE